MREVSLERMPISSNALINARVTITTSTNLNFSLWPAKHSGQLYSYEERNREEGNGMENKRNRRQNSH